MRKTTWLVTLALMGSAIAPPATAQESTGHPETVDAIPIQTVTMRGVRDPAMMPYERAFDLLGRIRKAGDGRMRLQIRIVSEKTLQPIPDLEVSLHGMTLHEKLETSPDGFLTVPLREEYLRDKAVFLTNQKEGTLRVEYFLVPVLPGENIRFRDIAASLAAARKAREEIVPWYIRPFLSGLTEVRICYPNDSQHINLIHGNTEVRAAGNRQENMLNKQTVYCGAFTARETAARPDTVLTMQSGWTALFN